MKTKTINAENKSSYMKEHFDAVMYHLSFGVTLPEGKENRKITHGSIPFVKKALEISARHPQFIPGYGGLPTFMKCKQTERDLKLFASEAKEVLSIITKENGSVSYLAYAYAKALYENVQHAAVKKNVSARTDYNKLKKHYTENVSYSTRPRSMAA